FSKPAWQLGSGTADGPFTSYVSLAAETGLLGFAAMIGLYAVSWWRLVSLARTTGDRVERSTALAAAGALLTLMAVSLLDNYLEQTRLGCLTWFLVGLAWSRHRALRLPRSLPDRRQSGTAQPASHYVGSRNGHAGRMVPRT